MHDLLDVLTYLATTLTGLYLTYGLLGGVGTGIVYVGVIGHMVQWFPDRRGFATGIVAAGYGMGALLTTFPIDMSSLVHGPARGVRAILPICIRSYVSAGPQENATCPQRDMDHQSVGR